jgi:hypothetical protein
VHVGVQDRIRQVIALLEEAPVRPVLHQPASMTRHPRMRSSIWAQAISTRSDCGRLEGGFLSGSVQEVYRVASMKLTPSSGYSVQQAARAPWLRLDVDPGHNFQGHRSGQQRVYMWYGTPVSAKPAMHLEYGPAEAGALNMGFALLHGAPGQVPQGAGEDDHVRHAARVVHEHVPALRDGEL